jgi:hypothetical protein
VKEKEENQQIFLTFQQIILDKVSSPEQNKNKRKKKKQLGS